MNWERKCSLVFITNRQDQINMRAAFLFCQERVHGIKKAATVHPEIVNLTVCGRRLIREYSHNWHSKDETSLKEWKRWDNAARSRRR